MKTRFYMLLALPALLLGSCVQNEGPETPAASGALRVTAGVAGGFATPTRAADNKWAEGDLIGVTTIAKASGNAIGDDQVNRMYMLSKISDDKLTADFAPIDDENALYFDDHSEWTFSAYYPYQDDEKIKIVTYNQSLAMNALNDIMAATGVKATHAAGLSTSPTVSFTGDHAFHHLMSKVEIRLKVAGGLTLADLDNYNFGLFGLVHYGFYTSPTPANPEGLLELDATAAAGNLKLPNLGAAAEGSDYRSFGEMFFLPQESTDAYYTATRMNASGDTEQRLVCTVSNDGTDTGKLELEAGKSYVITITLNETKAVLESCKIQDWTTTRFVGDLNDSNMTAGAADIDYSQTRIGDIMFEDGTTQTVDAYKANSDAIKAAHGSPIGIVSVLYGQYGSILKEGVANALADKGVTPHGLVMGLTIGKTVWSSQYGDVTIGTPRNGAKDAYLNAPDGIGFMNEEVTGTGKTILELCKENTGFEAFRWCLSQKSTDWTKRCTTGWYLPSYSEFVDMIISWMYVTDIVDETLIDSVIGKLKETGNLYSNVPLGESFNDVWAVVNSWFTAVDGNSVGHGYWLAHQRASNFSKGIVWFESSQLVLGLYGHQVDQRWGHRAILAF